MSIAVFDTSKAGTHQWRIDAEHRCPYVEEVDLCEIDVHWLGYTALEAHAFTNYIEGFTHRAISNEELAIEVAQTVADSVKSSVRVTVTFRVAGVTGTFTCATSPG